MAEQVRKPFIILAVIASILGIIGIFMIFEDYSGKAVLEHTEELEIINIDDVSSHSSPGDCWIIIGNEVYDVTVFAASYPEFKLVESCGSEGDISMMSNEVINVFQTYKIGKLG